MRRASVLIGGTAIALLVAVSATGALGSQPAPAAKKPKRPRAVTFNAKYPNRLVLATAAYRLTLSKDNGSVLELRDRRTSDRLVRGQGGCMWAATLASGGAFGGCAYGRATDRRFSYRWNRAASALTLKYSAPPGDDGVEATVVIAARKDYLDFRIRLQTHDPTVAAVLFPADLIGDVPAVRGVYTPTFLPGIKLLPSFFSYPHRNVERYPSRWAFADFLAADLGRSHFALSSINPAPSPIAPVDVGVIYETEPAACSGKEFCLTHAFQTWVKKGDEWASPRVRLRVGGSAEQSILAYRQENGIAAYPSLEAKLGDRLGVLSRAPLIKADLWKNLPRFEDWGAYVRRLPSPSLLHPVAFQARGHDEDYPDFLPPDSRWGTTADFVGALDDARSLGHVVMPYLNVSWWDNQSPTVRLLPAPLTAKDISMQNQNGAPVMEQFGDKDGYIVSPNAPYVRQRVAKLLEEWREVVPAECAFFDQIGARPWRRDFNPAAPTPLAYQDGWLAVFGRYRDRCLMAEDGWDRLADMFAGFHGGVLEMQREHQWPDERWGKGNWEPYPLALWLLHDKVLMYQHDLYEGTMADDPEVVLFNAAFGLVSSYNWDGDGRTLDSPWLGLVGRLQQTLGPHYAGKPLTGYRQLAPGVTRSEFGGYSVVANWSRSTPFEVNGHRIAPLGFLARAADGRVLAGAFGDTWTGVTFG